MVVNRLSFIGLETEEQLLLSLSLFMASQTTLTELGARRFQGGGPRSKANCQPFIEARNSVLLRVFPSLSSSSSMVSTGERGLRTRRRM